MEVMDLDGIALFVDQSMSGMLKSLIQIFFSPGTGLILPMAAAKSSMYFSSAQSGLQNDHTVMFFLISQNDLDKQEFTISVNIFHLR